MRCEVSGSAHVKSAQRAPKRVQTACDRVASSSHSLHFCIKHARARWADAEPCAACCSYLPGCYKKTLREGGDVRFERLHVGGVAYDVLYVVAAAAASGRGAAAISNAHSPSRSVNVGCERPLADAPLRDGAQLLRGAVALHARRAPVGLALREE